MAQAKTVVAVMVGILGTGLFLNIAGAGKLGEPVQKIALSITKGYGASA